eukprot:3990286-Pyramimonas_sp.AAC.1
MARKHVGVFPQQDVLSWETATHDAKVTIGLTYVIFCMKFSFPQLKGPRKLKACDGDGGDGGGAS